MEDEEKQEGQRMGGWTEELMEERARRQAAGDAEGVLRLEFGRYVTFMRELRKLTQREASKQARVTLMQWKNWERGTHLPRAAKIPALADALGVDAAGLFKRAGRAVPPEHAVYDMEKAVADFRDALLESESLADFLVTMQAVRARYYSERIERDAEAKMEREIVGDAHVHIDAAYSQAVAIIYFYLSAEQRLKLAKEVVQGTPGKTVLEAGIDQRHFIDRLDEAIAVLRERADDGGE